MTRKHGLTLLKIAHSAPKIDSNAHLRTFLTLPSHGIPTFEREKSELDSTLGCIREGAYADMLVVDGNPLEDLSLLYGQSGALKHIFKGGNIVNG